MEAISWKDFEKMEIRAGTVVEVHEFPEARKPAWILKIDFGEGNEPYKYRWARVRETHQEFQAAHPQCRRSRFELWNEQCIIAPLRALRIRLRMPEKSEP